MSDTPITDAAILSWAEFTDEGYGPSKYVHVDDMRALERDLIKAKQAISEGVLDKARLDWLQLHHEDMGITRDLKADTVYVDCNVTGILAYGENVRAAIDAAIQQEAPK
jgi:hypothetical protein